MAAAAIDETQVSAPVARPVAVGDFATVYRTWFHEVCRWLRGMGPPHADLEDLAQDVFLVVRRKLDRFDGTNLPGWLYRICSHVASNHRRRAWVRNLLGRRSDEMVAELPQVGLGPEQLLEQKQAQQLVRRALEDMSAVRRRAFYLFEVEGYSGEEIARLEEIPVATVRTRIFHARREFRAALRRLEPLEKKRP